MNWKVLSASLLFTLLIASCEKEETARDKEGDFQAPFQGGNYPILMVPELHTKVNKLEISMVSSTGRTSLVLDGSGRSHFGTHSEVVNGKSLRIKHEERLLWIVSEGYWVLFMFDKNGKDDVEVVFFPFGETTTCSVFDGFVTITGKYVDIVKGVATEKNGRTVRDR